MYLNSEPFKEHMVLTASCLVPIEEFDYKANIFKANKYKVLDNNNQLYIKEEWFLQEVQNKCTSFSLV